jgi:hypothetical protein
MWAIIEDGDLQQVLLNPVPFIVNGVQYGVEAFFDKTSKELADLGVYSLVRRTVNPKFYDVHGRKYVLYPDIGEVHEEDVYEPRNLHLVKLELQHEINERAKNILSVTDWMVVRALETAGARPVPEAVLKYRESVRSHADHQMDVIDDIASIENAEEYNPDEGWPAYMPDKKPYSRAAIQDASEKRIRDVMRKREMYQRYMERQKVVAASEEEK